MKPGMVVFWISDYDGAADEAKAYCKARGLTPADAKIVRKDEGVMVILKRSVDYGKIGI